MIYGHSVTVPVEVTHIDIASFPNHGNACSGWSLTDTMYFTMTITVPDDYYSNENNPTDFDLPANPGTPYLGSYNYVNGVVVSAYAPAPQDLNCNQLRDWHNQYHYQMYDFWAQNHGMTFQEVITQRGIGGGTLDSRPEGPFIHFIEDPLNPGIVIDMRHMLVIGAYGPLIAEYVEWNQQTEAPISAGDHQDYYSNQLGYTFYSNYGERLGQNPREFVNYLIEFLQNGTLRAPLNNPQNLNHCQ